MIKAHPLLTKFKSTDILVKSTSMLKTAAPTLYSMSKHVSLINSPSPKTKCLDALMSRHYNGNICASIPFSRTTFKGKG